MTISYGYWQGYTWKNELAVQSERVAPHFNEIFSASSEAEHNPMHMLDRAIVLAGFSVRRMIEKKLVTDRLVEEKMLVRSFAANHVDKIRTPLPTAKWGAMLAAITIWEKRIQFTSATWSWRTKSSIPRKSWSCMMSLR
jgi:hypothetical protein